MSKEVGDDYFSASCPSGSSKWLRSSTPTNYPEEKNLEGLDLQIVPHNQPALVSVYKDPVYQTDFFLS